MPYRKNNQDKHQGQSVNRPKNAKRNKPEVDPKEAQENKDQVNPEQRDRFLGNWRDDRRETGHEDDSSTDGDSMDSENE